MTGTVELDRDGQHLLIRFSYREDLVAVVKELPGRRWDPRQKVWRVPASAVEQVFSALSRHLFDFAPEIPSLLAGTLRATPPAAARGAPAPKAPSAAPTDAGTEPSNGLVAAPALSIAELNQRVRDGLRQLFPAAVWVVGEIVDFDKGAGRQHRFFQLVEKSPHEPRPVAAVEVAMFAAVTERLLPALANGEPALVLRDGLEIRALVKLDLYPASGRFQVVVQDIDPSFTLGKLALSREQILRELVQKGIAERNRSRGFPVPTLRIGVLTSPDADGWNDLLRHLQESGCGFEVTLYPVKVQGPELKPTLLAGLRWFADREASFDVVCIVRGGGSRTDLAWFDDRELALAVALHPLKIVVGIGHQRDRSVLDEIAHSEKTPTAVAELLVRGVEHARADLTERAERLRAAAADHLTALHRALQRTSDDLRRAVTLRLVHARTDLLRATNRLTNGTGLRLSRANGNLQYDRSRLTSGAMRALDRTARHLDHQAMRHRLLDPARVIARGFAVVRDEAGRVLPTAARLQPQQRVTLLFRDGSAITRIESVHREPS
ncbi:MAG: exodeoxyribonuclease VII large subunit [Planctomycetes bacterium]|jgi:exodeoxyribonuclease VII large subunit|nr:exodeoxyribonuclease VII large subunit [Planctomycetota bacterium]